MKKSSLLKMKNLPATEEMLAVAREDVPVKVGSGWNTSYRCRYSGFVRSAVEGGILKVTLYDPDAMRLGGTLPVYEIFMEKEKQQFLTYDRSHDKWRAAKIDYLEWQAKGSNNVWISAVDDAQIRQYLASDEKSVYRAILKFQRAVRDAELERRHRKETDPWDAELSQTPPLPKDWERWVNKVGIQENYIFYDYHRGGAKHGYCTYCEKEVALKQRPYRQIQEVVLSKNGFLYEEPNFLLKDEVQSANSYFSIIRAIADGNHKLGKIAGALGMETSSLTPYLSTLIDLDFLKKATPVTEKNPEKSRKGLYFISDNFIRFWFRYVYPYKGELELDNQQIVLDEMEKDFIQKFVAFSYEYICKDIFASLCRSKAVDFVPSRIGSYWLNDINGDTEIDVMAVDHQKKQVFAGECKYHNKPVDATVYYELEEKVKKSAELRTAFPGYKVLYGLFSKSGFTQRMLDQAEGRDDILLIQEDHIL